MHTKRNGFKIKNLQIVFFKTDKGFNHPQANCQLSSVNALTAPAVPLLQTLELFIEG